MFPTLSVAEDIIFWSTPLVFKIKKPQRKSFLNCTFYTSPVVTLIMKATIYSIYCRLQYRMDVFVVGNIVEPRLTEGWEKKA